MLGIVWWTLGGTLFLVVSLLVKAPHKVLTGTVTPLFVHVHRSYTEHGQLRLHGSRKLYRLGKQWICGSSRIPPSAPVYFRLVPFLISESVHCLSQAVYTLEGCETAAQGRFTPMFRGKYILNKIFMFSSR